MCETLSGSWEPTTIMYDNDTFRVVLPPVWDGCYDAANLDSKTQWYYESMPAQEWQQFREDVGLGDYRLTLVGERQTIVLTTNQRCEIGIIPEMLETIAYRTGEKPTRVAVFKQGKKVAEAYCTTFDHPETVISEVQARLKIAGKDESTVHTRKYGCLVIYGDFEDVRLGTTTEDLVKTKVVRGALRYLCDKATGRNNAKTAKDILNYLKAENLIDNRTMNWKPAQAFRGRFQSLYAVAIGRDNIDGWRYWIK